MGRVLKYKIAVQTQYWRLRACRRSTEDWLVSNRKTKGGLTNCYRFACFVSRTREYGKTSGHAHVNKRPFTKQKATAAESKLPKAKSSNVSTRDLSSWVYRAPLAVLYAVTGDETRDSQCLNKSKGMMHNHPSVMSFKRRKKKKNN